MESSSSLMKPKKTRRNLGGKPRGGARPGAGQPRKWLRVPIEAAIAAGLAPPAPTAPTAPPAPLTATTPLVAAVAAPAKSPPAPIAVAATAPIPPAVTKVLDDMLGEDIPSEVDLDTEIRKAARRHVKFAIRSLVSIVATSTLDSARVAAARAILAAATGKGVVTRSQKELATQVAAAKQGTNWDSLINHTSVELN